MRLPDPGRPEEYDVLVTLEEPEFVQALDMLALDARLEGEVELRQRLHRRQPRRAHRRLQTVVVAQQDLGAEQLLHRFAGRDRAAVGLGQDAVHGLERTGYLQVRQRLPQPVAAVAVGAHRTSAA